MYRAVGSSIIFDVLWTFISFGHGNWDSGRNRLADHPLAEGLPLPGRDSAIDSVDDFFRIRLICALLDTCGACFDRGAQKRKLDLFLVVLQVRR